MTTQEKLASIPLPDQAVITKSLHFGLLIPPSPFTVPCGWEWVHKAPFEGPSIIASLIKGLGYKFTLLDQRDCDDPAELKDEIKDLDIIGICTYEDGFIYIKKVVELIKSLNPKIPVILGGPLVTSAPKLIMENTLADYAVIGEGELTLIEILDFISGDNPLLPIDQIAGIAWKNDCGKTILNKPREQMQSLDIVPFQDFSVWEKLKNKSINEIYLSYSRGCAYNCSFCYRAMPKLRYKSISRVKKELEYLKRHGFKMAWWNDLTFTLDHNYVHRLLDEAISVHQFRWSAFARIDSINLPLLKHMKKMGCDIVLYGFESISQEILDSFNKKTCKTEVEKAIFMTKQAEIKIGGLFIIGSPNETKESLNNLIEFCRQFKEITRVKYLSAIPGTDLYRKAIKNGFIKDEIKHLEWLSREKSSEEDIEDENFLMFSKNITKDDLRTAYQAINGLIEKRPYEYKK